MVHWQAEGLRGGEGESGALLAVLQSNGKRSQQAEKPQTQRIEEREQNDFSMGMFNNSIYRKTRYYASMEQAHTQRHTHPHTHPVCTLQNITKNCCQRQRRMLSLSLSLSMAKCKMYLNLSPLLASSRWGEWEGKGRRRGDVCLCWHLLPLSRAWLSVCVSVCVCTLKFMQMLRCVSAYGQNHFVQVKNNANCALSA